MTGKDQQAAQGKAPQNGRGTGRSKTRCKKKRYQAHCHAMRTSGYVTDSNGSWTTNWTSLRISDASFRGSTAK